MDNPLFLHGVVHVTIFNRLIYKHLQSGTWIILDQVQHMYL